jgi:hypothetical protein
MKPIYIWAASHDRFMVSVVANGKSFSGAAGSMELAETKAHQKLIEFGGHKHSLASIADALFGWMNG